MRVAIHWQTHDCPSDITMNTAWGTVRMELRLQGKLLTRLVIAQAGEYTDATRSSRSLQVSGFIMLITSDTYIYPKGIVHEGNLSFVEARALDEKICIVASGFLPSGMKAVAQTVRDL